MTQNSYESPFSWRYGSERMRENFSIQKRVSTWRKLWIALAEAQKNLGLGISEEQISEMKKNAESINFDKADQLEKELRHDVMAHIKAYGLQCPKAKPIIHLGATSCFVTDNGDLIQIRDGLEILIAKLTLILKQLAQFADTYKDLPCLGYTHFQAAQLTTVGKRACLWAQDFLEDLKELRRTAQNLKFLGVKGATGTQASFLALFNNDPKKVVELERQVAEKLNFQHLYTITGQTYPRKQDVQILNVLASLGASAHKFATDLRLLSHTKELEEPFGEQQVGSSAMPYKRNPITSEQTCGIARFLITLAQNPLHTAANQWLERSLDDSSNRRVVIAEAFLAADQMLNSVLEMSKKIVVNSAVIARKIQEELPFLATENILMHAVTKGGDRQALHEKLRTYSVKTGDRIKNGDGVNDLLDQIKKDPSFALNEKELLSLLNVKNFIGLAPEQVTTFLKQELEPELKS